MSAASLDDLAQHPEKLADLTPITARALLIQYAGLHAALLATAFPVEDGGRDRYLTAEEASQEFGLSVDFLRRHKSNGVPIHRPSPGKVLYSVKDLERFMRLRREKA